MQRVTATFCLGLAWQQLRPLHPLRGSTGGAASLLRCIHEINGAECNDTCFLGIAMCIGLNARER
jgi:hypothetical protein